MAVRLRTESELCHDEPSVKASACPAALRERYSCSMYSGYRPRTFTEAFLRLPILGPICCPLRAREAVHRTVHSSKIAPIFRRWHSVQREDSQRGISCFFLPSFLPSSCSSTASSNDAVNRRSCSLAAFIEDSCPLTTSDHLQACDHLL